MKKLLLALFVILVFGVFGYGQPVDAAAGDLLWTQINNPTNSDTGYGDTAYSIVSDSSFAYIVGDDYIPGNAEWRIEKRSLSDGSLEWAQSYNFSTLGDYARGVAVDSTGVYIVGTDGSLVTEYQWRIEKRSLTDGSLLWSKTSNPSSSTDQAYGVAVNAFGVYVVGSDWSASGHEWRIEKRTLDTGDLITSFGSSGAITSNPTGNPEIAYDIAVDSTSLYVIGDDYSPGYNEWRIEKRSLNSGSLISSFGTSGVVNVNVGVIGAQASGVAVDLDAIYIVGWDASRYRWHTEKRSLTTGALLWSKTGTTNYDAAFDVAVDSSGVYIVGSQTDHTANPNNSQWLIEKRSLSDGTLLWSKANNPSPNEPASGKKEAALGVAVNSFGLFVVGGDYTLGASNGEWRIEKRSTSDSCSGPFPVAWTDPTITANSTKIRKVHLDELRTEINLRRLDAGLADYAWTDPVVATNSTKIRKVHIDELRQAISEVYSACGQTLSAWTDPTLNANSTKIRKVHFDELRAAVSNAE